MEHKDLSLSLRSGSIIKLFAIAALFAALFYLRDLVVIILVAVVLASAMEPFLRRIMKLGLSRGTSVVALLLVTLVFIGTGLALIVPKLADDIARFIKTVPLLLESVRIFGLDIGFKSLADAVTQFSKDLSGGKVLAIIKESLFAGKTVFATTGVVIGGIVNAVLTFIIAFYLAAEEDGVKKFLRVVVPRHREVYVEELWDRAQKKISLWMQGQLFLSLIISLLIFIPLVILGMPYAFLLALFAFVGELIPVVGLTLAMIPALLLGWFHGGLPLLGIVFLVFFIVGQLENHVLYPKIMNKLVGVPSVLIIISILIGAKLAGFWGIVLAVPMASIFMELISDIEKKRAREHQHAA